MWKPQRAGCTVLFRLFQGVFAGWRSRSLILGLGPGITLKLQPGMQISAQRSRD